MSEINNEGWLVSSINPSSINRCCCCAVVSSCRQKESSANNLPDKTGQKLDRCLLEKCIEDPDVQNPLYIYITDLGVGSYG